MKEQIDVAALHPFYRGISELIGVESMLKIFDQYKGMQLTIPIHLYDRNLAAQHVLKQYDGHNSYNLANKYGYSQRWVIKVIKNQQ
ncbi:Mor transcription activator family protein [Lactiplantibacillus modestisalitolerans]|uniref:Mor transcription activator family protein n=1 Tax=Lactiplantibacillus modestisalitolerans TaxID=1457219 RepID=A0ABV5WRI0_9LACO|nr:Mor transcription activator family protein [Lactiplantibacillus modestisalitolerans]